MNTNELYACAYKEVIYILSMFSDDEWNKIPEETKNFYFENMNKNHKFYIDKSKKIEDYELLPQTKAILANIYINFLASTEEKKEIEELEKKIFEDDERKKRERYNPDDIFHKDEKLKQYERVNNESLLIVEKENIIKKILKKIKDLFNK